MAFLWPKTPAVMGIINVTPDSFSDGGLNAFHDAAIAAGHAMIAAGAAILDVGGESTRPGAIPTSPDEEQRRILPVVDALAGTGTPISADTRNASTMRAALEAGATIINDVSALRHDPGSISVVDNAGCLVVLMHMRGAPQTMRTLTQYEDVAAEVAAELAERVAYAEAAGIRRDRIALDPGIGFAKTPAQNLALLRGLSKLAALGLPILVGASRKTFIGTYGDEPDPQRRLPGSLAAALFALSQGATVLRVHDVAETVQAVKIWQALAGGRV